ncbi:MAG: prepilin-type N-terminal cleavage/methylation domain-containing protein [Burkholderiales bacterium]|nr:prepilin-type N-terminal cleavage/methylation domain-containing protein [Burkholderiales bacterium]
MNFSKAVSTCGPSAADPDRGRGFTLLELVIAMAIVAILAAIALPAYQQHVQTARVAAASADIMLIQQRISQYVTVNNALPPDLAAIHADTVLDPWGRPYVYLNFTGLRGHAQMRKDKNLVPINTQYDLYSVGADGQSRPPLTAAMSKDDVILANDGNYIGLASNY